MKQNAMNFKWNVDEEKLQTQENEECACDAVFVICYTRMFAFDCCVCENDGRVQPTHRIAMEILSEWHASNELTPKRRKKMSKSRYGRSTA